jgi:hypothetical protein
MLSKFQTFKKRPLSFGGQVTLEVAYILLSLFCWRLKLRLITVPWNIDIIFHEPNLIDRWTLHLSACIIDCMWQRCVNTRMQCTASSNSIVNLSDHSWTLKVGCKFCQTCFIFWSAITRWRCHKTSMTKLSSHMEPSTLFDACHLS